MGKQSSSKGRDGADSRQSASGSGSGGSSKALLYVVIVVAIAGVAAFVLRGTRPAEPAASNPADEVSKAAENSAAKADPVAAAAEASARATAAFGPHKQASLPPIPFAAYDPPRPVAVVTAAYEFAAEHPEITSYVPCFCGCEQGGHRGNHDCFVKTRAANGDVVAWEPHGVECAVCIDVATRSRQMHASGASVRDIRAAIEKEFVPTSPVMTPTPKPPALGQ